MAGLKHTNTLGGDYPNFQSDLCTVKLPVETFILLAHPVIDVINLAEIDVELVLVQDLQQETLLIGKAQLCEILSMLILIPYTTTGVDVISCWG